MQILETIDDYKALLKNARKDLGKLHTNCFLFTPDVKKYIRQKRAYYLLNENGFFLFIDEERYYTLYYHISLNSGKLHIKRADKPILIRTLYQKDKKSAAQEQVDELLLGAGFELLDSTTKVWTDVKENLGKMGKIYDRTEEVIKRYGLRVVIAEEEHLDEILELRDSTPELKMYHIPYQTREEEIQEIKNRHFACIIDKDGHVCAARKIEEDRANLYSPWFCVKKEYRDKYGLGIVMTGYEMKYAQDHGLSKVYGWIANDNTGSWNYHLRLGVNVTSKVADEWVLQ